MNQAIPSSTLHTLGALIVLVFDAAVSTAGHVIERIKPLVSPPADLELVARSGAVYSGVLFVDRGAVVAGVIVQTGQTLPVASLLSPRSTPVEEVRPARVAHWSDDTTEYRGDLWRNG